jgi:hypothetical protein
MARPRVFISSTCFDLNDIRSELTDFFEKYNFEVLNSQLKNFGVTPQKHSHTACLDQVNNADYLILIIGRRRGGTYIGSEKSITNEEYNLAIKRGIPIVIFVDRQVEDAIPLYKKNPAGDFSTIVDDKRIFHFIEFIRSSSEDNWLHKYSNINDIKDTLKAQLSYYLLLFSQGLIKSIQKEKKSKSTKLAFVKFPSNLGKIKKKKLDQDAETGLRNGLKELHKIISNILTSAGKNDNKLEKLKAMWVIAKHGELNWDGTLLTIDNDLFKDYAWSTGRGTRVFSQMRPFGIIGDYDQDEDAGKITISLHFKREDEDHQIACALITLVEDLIKKYDDDDAYELFRKSDMRIYMV